MIKIDWWHLVSAAIPFVVLFIIKFLLDLNLAHKLVKFLFWIPTRWISRDNPTRISGNWSHEWTSDSESFPEIRDRHSQTTLRQLDSYCYGEFTAKKKRYILFGKISGNYLLGKWYDADDPVGYFGAFQLQIRSSEELRGRWIGHSKEISEIRYGDWIWERTL